MQEENKTKYHIEEVFEEIMAGDKVEIESLVEGTIDYILYARHYEILTSNQIKHLKNKGFEIEYIEPGRDTTKGTHTRIRFRATPPQ